MGSIDQQRQVRGHLTSESGPYLVNQMTTIPKADLWGELEALKIRHQAMSLVRITYSFLAMYSLSLRTSHGLGSGGLMMELLNWPKKKGIGGWSPTDGPDPTPRARSPELPNLSSSSWVGCGSSYPLHQGHPSCYNLQEPPTLRRLVLRRWLRTCINSKTLSRSRHV